jgi:hypothetical protein
MKPLPLPVRVAAGLAVTAVDQARHLPEKLAELPVTMVSQALQLSMRLQQQVTELAIKGDDALSTLRPVEESPVWATFDEDTFGATDGTSRQQPSTNNVHRSPFDATEQNDDAPADAASRDPWSAEEQALAHELDSDETLPDNVKPLVETDSGTDVDDGPTALPNYAELTLPQVRARLRRLDVAQLTELVEYERAHGDRPAFVGMLTRRLSTLHEQQ